MTNIRVRVGQTLGLDHQLKQRNCQDSYALHAAGDVLVAVVCDGCSEGERSEVGAALGAQALAAQAAHLLTEGVPLAEMPPRLYHGLIDYLEHITALSRPLNRVDFVRDHLLFTTLMLIATPNDALILTAGDGLIVANEQVTCIDHHNVPFYIAYHLVSDALLTGFQMPQGFQVQHVQGWQRLAIGTDGFVADLLPQVWSIPHVRGLQRKMNVWASLERRFRDDATLITIERTQDAESTE